MNKQVQIKLISLKIILIIFIVIDHASSKWILEWEENFDKLDLEKWSVLEETNSKSIT